MRILLCVDMCANRYVNTTIFGKKRETWKPQCLPPLPVSLSSKDVSIRLVSASKIILCTAQYEPSQTPLTSKNNTDFSSFEKPHHVLVRHVWYF